MNEIQNHQDNIQKVPRSRWLPWRQQSYWLVLVAILFITLSAAVPLWGPGIINTRGGGDSPFLIQRTLEMAENIKHVVFPPRWMSHAAYGYGYPFFNHYGALPYYISGSLSLLGMPVTLAIQGTQTLGFVLAGFAMALWASQIYKNKWSIILSSAAYTYAPFHMVNIYIRGDSLSEFYAFIWFPLILWALHRYAKVPSWSRMCIIACTYGGLILTHNTSAVTFSPFALLYAIALTLKTKGAPKNRQPIIIFKQYLIPIIVPFLLGVLLTMWFWLPAIAEIKFGQLGPDFTEGYFHHSQHYRGLNLVQNSVAFDYSIALKAEDAGPFSMGLVQAILAGCGVLFFWFSHKRRHMVWVNLYLLSSLALTTVIMTPLSAFLWDNISLLRVTQFPWRFLSIQAVFTAAITANIPNSIRKKKEEVRHFTKQQLIVRTLLSASAIILLAGAALVNLHPDRLAINNDDVSWDNLLLYEIFTGNIGTTIRHEYLPKNVVPRPYITQAILDQDIGPKIDGDGDMIAHLLERGPAEQSWHIQLKSTASQPHELITVAFPLYWWPGWQAKVNGTSIPTYALPGSGELALDVPEGAHDIVLRLHGTKLQKLAMGVSCITAILVIVSVTIERCFSLAPKKRLGYDRVLVILLLVTTSLLLPVMWNSPYENNGRYYDFEQMPAPGSGQPVRPATLTPAHLYDYH